MEMARFKGAVASGVSGNGGLMVSACTTKGNAPPTTMLIAVPHRTTRRNMASR